MSTALRRRARHLPRAKVLEFFAQLPAIPGRDRGVWQCPLLDAWSRQARAYTGADGDAVRGGLPQARQERPQRPERTSCWKRVRVTQEMNRISRRGASDTRQVMRLLRANRHQVPSRRRPPAAGYVVRSPFLNP